MAQGPDILQNIQYKFKDRKQIFEYGVKQKTLFRLLAKVKIDPKNATKRNHFHKRDILSKHPQKARQLLLIMGSALR